MSDKLKQTPGKVEELTLGLLLVVLKNYIRGIDMIKKYAVEVISPVTGIPCYVGTLNDWLHPLIPAFTAKKECSFHFRAAWAIANFLKRNHQQVMVVACK